ncbi:acyltransferase domain-containing protein [Actinomadura madurae]|nr:acyltransferase domain-containing protein [Actinomadura madurae]
MAVDLIDQSPVFAECLADCERALAPHVDWSLTDVLRGADPADLERVDVVQPVLFAVMVSLAALWRSYGVRPAAVIGHSQGEIAAACVAGALSLEDAARVSALRARTLRGLSGSGGMLSITASEAWVRERIEPFAGRVAVAAVNGPNTVVVSGDHDALRELGGVLAEAGVMRWNVQVDFSAHSGRVEALEAELEELLAGIRPRPAEVPFYSTVTAGLLDGRELDAAYWYRNLREPVRFGETVRALIEAGNGMFVEVSPHPVLVPGIQENVDEAGAAGSVVTGTLRRSEGGLRRFLMAAAEVHVAGVPVDWGKMFRGSGVRTVELPSYPFQRRHYWLLDEEPAAPAPAGLGTTGGHPLLTAAVALAGSGALVLTGRLSLDTQPWLAEHAVLGEAVVPGVALMEMAVRAGELVDHPILEELVLERPLSLPASGGVLVQVTARPSRGTGQTHGERPRQTRPGRGRRPRPRRSGRLGQARARCPVRPGARRAEAARRVAPSRRRPAPRRGSLRPDGGLRPHVRSHLPRGGACLAAGRRAVRGDHPARGPARGRRPLRRASRAAGRRPAPLGPRCPVRRRRRRPPDRAGRTGPAVRRVRSDAVQDRRDRRTRSPLPRGRHRGVGARDRRRRAPRWPPSTA